MVNGLLIVPTPLWLTRSWELVVLALLAVTDKRHLRQAVMVPAAVAAATVSPPVAPATVPPVSCQLWQFNRNAALANRDLLDLPGLSDLQEKTVQTAKTVLMANPARMVLSCPESVPLLKPVKSARLGHQDPLEKKDPKADLALRASLAMLEPLELKANVEALVPEVLLATLANLDPKVLLVTLANRLIRKAHLAELDPKEHRVMLEHLDLLAHLASPVMSDLLEKQEMQVMLVPTARTAVQDHRDHLDLVELQAAVAIAHRQELRPATTPRIRSKQPKPDIPKRNFTKSQLQLTLTPQHCRYLLIVLCSSEGFATNLVFFILLSTSSI